MEAMLLAGLWPVPHDILMNPWGNSLDFSYLRRIPSQVYRRNTKLLRLLSLYPGLQCEHRYAIGEQKQYFARTTTV